MTNLHRRIRAQRFVKEMRGLKPSFDFCEDSISFRLKKCYKIREELYKKTLREII